MKYLFESAYGLNLPESQNKVIVENKAATYKRLLDTKKGTKFYESIDLKQNLPNYAEVPLESEVFDLNKIPFEHMYRGYIANVVKYARSEEEAETAQELLAQKKESLAFSPQALEFGSQVASCHWFLVPELNSRKFLVNYFEALDLSCRSLKTIDASITDWNRLTSLDLSGNAISEINYLPLNLVKLNLSNNNISDIRMPSELLDLLTLDLSFNNLGESCLERVRFTFPNLLDLNVSYNNITSIVRFCDEFKAFCDKILSLYVSPNPFTLNKGYRLYLIENLPKVKYIDGYDVSFEQKFYKQIQNVVKESTASEFKPPVDALRYCFKFDPKTDYTEVKTVDFESQFNYTLNVKINTLYEIPLEGYNNSNNSNSNPLKEKEDPLKLKYRLDIFLSNKSWSIDKIQEPIDNPDKANPEKNNCLKINFAESIPLAGSAGIKVLMQGIFIKLYEQYEESEKLVGFTRIDLFKYCDPLRDLWDFNNKRVKVESGGKGSTVSPKDLEAVGLRGWDSEYFVQLIDADKHKTKDFLVGNPLDSNSNWGLNNILKDYAMDKKVGKLKEDKSADIFKVKGILHVDASVTKEKL